VLKVGGLVFLVIIGFILFQGHEILLDTEAPPTETMNPFGHVTAAVMLIIFSYIGWDRVGYSAGEMKNPKRVIPLSMFCGIGALIIIYVLVNVVYYRTLGMEGMRESTIVASDAATHLIGPIGAGFIALVVIISTTGSINGNIMTAPRVYYAMAKDGLFLKWLNYVHPKFRTPSRAILAHCIWSSAILLIRGSFETIAAGMVFVVLVFYALTTIALFKLRNNEIGGENVYRIRFYPFLPGLYLVGIITLIIFRSVFEWQNSLKDLAFVASGLLASLIWLRKKSDE
jgi:APA family basic amino acid/polyamine antiporter